MKTGSSPNTCRELRQLLCRRLHTNGLRSTANTMNRTVAEVEVDADCPVGRLQVAVVRYELNRHRPNLIFRDHVQVVHQKEGAVPKVDLPRQAKPCHAKRALLVRRGA